MERIDNKIIFVDENGLKTELSILFTYKNEERNREYVFFYHEENPLEIIVGYLNENEILDVEDDEEYDELEEVLLSFQEENLQ